MVWVVFSPGKEASTREMRAEEKPCRATVLAHLDTVMPEGLLLTFPGMERVGRLSVSLPLRYR